MEAARRELLEETGYQAEELTSIGTAYTLPALLSDRHYTFLARDVRKVAEPNLGKGEDIEIVLLPPSHARFKIAEGEITSGQVILAFYWYLTTVSDQ